MRSIFFWKSWPSDYKVLWFLVSGVFLFSLVFMWFGYFQGADGVINWEKIQEQKTIETTVHSFRLGPFSLNIPAESYVIFEYLQGSDLHHNVSASYIFLVILVFSAMILLAVITTLDKFWFYLGMGLFILFVISLRLDVLLVFGLRGLSVPSTVLLLFIAVSFFFKSFRSHTSFITRVASFIALACFFGAIIWQFSQIPFPFLQLSVTSYLPALIITILFIIMIAHEVVAAFIPLTSQPTKSLRHFLVITTIYLVNVFITSLHAVGYLQWDFVYINLYLLISLSGLLAVWGFRTRENLYQNIFPFSPFGALFIVALGAIGFAFIGQLLGNANDAALKVIRDIIIFSHAGFGLVFVMYVVSNFVGMMAGNLPVTKVLYKPNRMPYFTFRLAGIIVALAFVFVSYWRDYVYHSMAGFYNYVADLYIMQGNETLGRAFYERSRSNAFQNHRANYALAMLKASRIDFEEAANNFELANGKRPSDYSLVNGGNLHLWKKEYFPAIQKYNAAERIRKIPALSNNLGFAYARVHNLDSSVFYISEARKHDQTKSSAESNFFALIASEYLPVKTDSILRVFDNNTPTVVANAMAAATLFEQDFEGSVDPLQNGILDLYSATLLNNYIIRNARVLDTTFTNTADRIASDSLNYAFSEALKASLAYAFYHQGNVYKAQQILAELSYLTQSYQGKYNYIMGLWALEQGSPRKAHSYFTHAVNANYKQAKLYDAIALTEAGDLTAAMVAWDSVAGSDDEASRRMAARIKHVLSSGADEALRFNDGEKYQYARYRLNITDTIYFSRLVNSFENQNYKAQALLDMSKKLFATGDVHAAIRFYNQIGGLSLSDKNLYDDIRHFELQMLASRGEVRALAQQINKDISFDSTRRLEKMLYTALLNESAGNLSQAEKQYAILGSWNPYYEEGILAAAEFFRKQDAESVRPYDILAEAIQINNYSTKLLRAYAEEALRQGFDDYARSAMERLRDLQ